MSKWTLGSMHVCKGIVGCRRCKAWVRCWWCPWRCLLCWLLWYWIALGTHMGRTIKIGESIVVKKSLVLSPENILKQMTFLMFFDVIKTSIQRRFNVLCGLSVWEKNIILCNFLSIYITESSYTKKLGLPCVTMVTKKRFVRVMTVTKVSSGQKSSPDFLQNIQRYSR